MSLYEEAATSFRANIIAKIDDGGKDIALGIVLKILDNCVEEARNKAILLREKWAKEAHG